MQSDRVILGIDPGTVLMGYGIVEVKCNRPSLVVMGYLELNKFDDHFVRLQKIFERVLHLIDQYHPNEMALEAPFFGKNVQSMLKLGRAQGVAMSAGLYRNIPISEYLPRKVKQSITGNGNASKEQVAAFLKGMLKLTDLPDKLDATDGLAVAVCHYLQFNALLPDTSSAKSWKDFISKNPGRIK
jgi:crossover junction endodeoxyribonuclease RuvC